jgi:hypothetical protein
MDIHGYASIYMHIYGYPCISIVSFITNNRVPNTLHHDASCVLVRLFTLRFLHFSFKMVKSGKRFTIRRPGRPPGQRGRPKLGRPRRGVVKVPYASLQKLMKKDALNGVLTRRPRRVVVKVPDASLQKLMEKDALNGVLSLAARKEASSFVQAPSNARQEGEIFGIPKELKETFEINLALSQKEEHSNQQTHEELKIAEEAGIKAGQAQIDTKSQELADTDEKNAQSIEDTEDTDDTEDTEHEAHCSHVAHSLAHLMQAW